VKCDSVLHIRAVAAGCVWHVRRRMHARVLAAWRKQRSVSEARLREAAERVVALADRTERLQAHSFGLWRLHLQVLVN